MKATKGLLLALLVTGFLPTLALGNSVGCGLGTMILPGGSIVSQTLAMTTNHSTATQFFGVTTGTSGCSNSGFVMRDKEAEAFAEANMKSLKIDMARGQGESLSAFAQILGCQEQGISSFGKMTQSRYEKIFPTENIEAGALLKSVQSEMQNDSSVQLGCSTRI